MGEPLKALGATVITAALLLTACANSSSASDDATNFAITACGIAAPTNDGDAGSNDDYTYAGRGDEPFDWDTDATILNTNAKDLQAQAVAASSAKSISPTWQELSDSYSLASAFATRFSEEKQDRPGWDYISLLKIWPTVEQDGAAYNDALKRIEIECTALTSRLNAQ